MAHSKLHKGLTNKSVKASDASTKLPGKNIDKDAVRSSVGKGRGVGSRSA